MKWPAVIQVDNTAAISFQKRMNPDSKLKGAFDLRSGWLEDMRKTDQFETKYMWLHRVEMKVLVEISLWRKM